MDAEHGAADSGPPLSWSQLPGADKREVFRLAHLGERHPSPGISNAVSGWAYRDAMDKWWNRAPGWLLPSLGVLVVVIGVVGDLTILIVGGALVIVSGLLGWNTTRSTALLRKTYSR